MQDWMRDRDDDPLPWLLDSDPDNPGVRYFALTDLLHRTSDQPEVLEARRSVMSTRPVPTIREAQEADGYWVKPGPGYNPNYRSTVWSLSMLAQLGADGSDVRVLQTGAIFLKESANGPDLSGAGYYLELDLPLPPASA